jgi:hypothetical protein
MAAEAVRGGKAGAPDLARLLSSAGAHLAHSENGEFQPIVDGVKLTTKTETELGEE